MHQTPSRWGQGLLQGLDSSSPFLDGCGSIKPKDMQKAFESNMRRVGAKYELLAMTSQKAVEIYNKEIDLILIDGNHHELGVSLDVELWLPRVKVGGYAIFHDYGSSGWPGVTKVVDRISKEEFSDEGKQQTIIVKKRIHEQIF